MNINICGWFNRKNVGDESFKIAFDKMFENTDHKITYVTPPTICSPNADLIILGGGAVVAPYYMECLPPNVPKVAFGVDLGYESESQLLKGFSSVHVRHATDVPLIKQSVACPVESIPDLAYVIKPSGADVLSRFLKRGKKKVLGVMLTDYVNPAIDRPIADFRKRADSFITNLTPKLVDMYQSGKWDILMIPCSTGGHGDDRRINLDIGSQMEDQPIQIMETLSPQETVDLIAQCDLTICMKFHAHIFSIIAGTPFLSIPFARKVKLMLKENGLGKEICGYFEGSEFNVELFEKTLNDVVERAADYRHHFLKLAAANHIELSEVMRRVQRGWTEEFS